MLKILVAVIVLGLAVVLILPQVTQAGLYLRDQYRKYLIEDESQD